jgi:hypothetical protein
MNAKFLQKRNFVMFIFIVGLLFQIMGTIRYIMRLPDDWLGIALYILTITAFFILIIIHIHNSKKMI